MTLDELYQQELKNSTDIQEHLHTLKEYAARCKSIVEFGVRYGTSTTALTLGLCNGSRMHPLDCYSLTLVDKIPRPDVFNRLKEVCQPVALNYDWSDSLVHFIPKPVDMIFIDTWHTTDLLWKELKRHAPRTKKWILIHDTKTYGKVNEGGGYGGLWPAIRRYCRSYPWRVRETLKNCNGLTVLERTTT